MLTREANDVILWFATLVFLFRAGVNPWMIAAVGTLLAFGKDWE